MPLATPRRGLPVRAAFRAVPLAFGAAFRVFRAPAERFRETVETLRARFRRTAFGAAPRRPAVFLAVAPLWAAARFRAGFRAAARAFRAGVVRF